MLIKMNIASISIFVILHSFALLVLGQESDFNIDLKQPNAEVYHEQSNKNNQFNYGYQVEQVNSQFQHKVKGPDDVTYGCYGFIDPDNQKHLYYYVADRLGYRLIPPNQPTKIFTQRVTESLNKLEDALKDKQLDARVVAWNDLYLPDSCRKLEEILTITPAPKPQIPSSPPDQNSAFAGSNILTSIVQPPVTTPKPTQAPVPTTPLAREVPVSVPTTAKPVTTPATTARPAAPVTVPPTKAPASAPKTISAPPSANCNQQLPGSSPLLGQFNGYVYPINGECDSSNNNVQLLLSQMEALNAQVLELTTNIQALQGSANASASADCKLWLDRCPSPLLIYVPIFLPFTSSASNATTTSALYRNPASFQYQQRCEDCVNK